MEKLHIIPTTLTPEIIFSPDEKIFVIRGISSPEDVRALYYPVIEWFSKFSDEVLVRKKVQYPEHDPLTFRIDLKYFNSSSAKFLHDIFNELKKFIEAGVPVSIEWLYEEDDIDLLEAGNDLAVISGLEFTYIRKDKK
jgi:hypothetical protein